MKKPITVHIVEFICKLETFFGELADRMVGWSSVSSYYEEQERLLNDTPEYYIIQNPLNVSHSVYPDYQYGAYDKNTTPATSDPLKIMLEHALKVEDYELAAEIRDQIKKENRGI